MGDEEKIPIKIEGENDPIKEELLEEEGKKLESKIKVGNLDQELQMLQKACGRPACIPCSRSGMTFQKYQKKPSCRE